MLYKKPVSFLRILYSKAVVAVVVNLLFGCFLQVHYFGAAFLALLPGKLIQQVIQVPIQSLIFYLVVLALKKAKVFNLV